MYQRLLVELLAYLQEGPYLGGWSSHRWRTFSFIRNWRSIIWAGLDKELFGGHEPAIRDWLQRVSDQLPANPILVPDFMLVHQTIV